MIKNGFFLKHHFYALFGNLKTMKIFYLFSFSVLHFLHSITLTNFSKECDSFWRMPYWIAHFFAVYLSIIQIKN